MLLEACGASVIGLIAYKKTWLTIDGALAAIPIGALAASGLDTMMMLLAFFLSGSIATKVAAKKLNLLKGDAKHGRNAWQVLATGGLPAAMLLYADVAPNADKESWKVAYMAYLACSCGDTLASELGQLSSETPILITSLGKAEKGRDGAVSLLGSLASLGGGLLVGACSGTLFFFMLGGLYGAVGSLLDSLLGAVLQSPARVTPLNWKRLNIAVNALSSLATAALAWMTYPRDDVNVTLSVATLALFVVIGLKTQKN